MICLLQRPLQFSLLGSKPMHEGKKKSPVVISNTDVCRADDHFTKYSGPKRRQLVELP